MYNNNYYGFASRIPQSHVTALSHPFVLKAAKMRMLVFVSVLFYMSACTYGLPPLSEWLKTNNESNIFALLVAGSQSWMNYRHQVRSGMKTNRRNFGCKHRIVCTAG